MLIFDQLKKSDPSLRVLSLLILAGITVLLGGLWFLQIISYKRYVQELTNQSFRTVRVPAVRGKILDCNGVALAENRPSYNINLYLEELRPLFQKEYSSVRSQAVAQVKGKLTREQIDYLGRYARYRAASNLVMNVGYTIGEPITFAEEGFRKHYDARRSLPMSVRANLPPNEVARFAETGASIPGVDLQIQSLRWYPGGSLASHVLGHMRRSESADSDDDISFNYRLPDFEGVVGIEGTFDENLRGKAGVNTLLVNHLAYRQSESVWAPSEPGNNIVLTIDSGLQRVAEKALKASRADARGAVVVLDVNTGDILAMASAPTFDPNSFLDGVTPEEMQRLNDPKLKPQINRATQGIYAPGSIFKMVIGMAALDHGNLKPAETFNNPGFYMLGRRRIDDTAPSGNYDFKRALKLSSNTYFIYHGLKTPLDDIIDLGNRCFLGKPTGLPTRQEASGYFPTTGVREKREGGGWRDGDTANLCIGQGDIAVTPLQMAVMTAAIANGGKVMWPRLVAKIESPDADFDRTIKEYPASRVRGELGVSAQSIQIVHDAMLADVEEGDGTGRLAQVPGLKICGKTGTAQVTRGRAVVDHITWFVSFAPYDKPRYAVVAMVESGASGGATCAPIARQVYQEIHRRDMQLNRKSVVDAR
ncbi:MAG TPA: penicillin-binding protein 2 [Roseimicrobium sp.]|nr:penicillin-binding protein 2 [Roseimicrobium sp.]